MTNKIPEENENPIDVILCRICDKMNPILYNYNFTPNIITTISFIFTLLVVYFIINGNYVLASLSYILFYFFDCADGKFARKYNMVTRFGDYYDHITDILGFILPIIVIYLNKNISRRYFKTIIIISLIFLYLSLFHTKNYELFYIKNNNSSENESSFLENILTKIVPDIEIDMKFTKYLGAGTFNIVFAILLYLTNFNINKI
jgi:phosphatidylglycerophosphate synthase